jgi:hypothetical protein
MNHTTGRRLGTVALAATALAGVALSETALVWVLAVYWVDTAVVVLAALTRQAVARRDTSTVRALGPFLLLTRTRGDLSLLPGLPPVPVRNLRPVATGLLVAAVGTGLTAVAVWATVPVTALTPLLGGALVVAYDERTETVRWRVPYTALSEPTVERGVRGRPLWHSTGSVTASRTDTPPESELEFSRSDIAFVYLHDPETVAEWLRVGGPTRG